MAFLLSATEPKTCPCGRDAPWYVCLVDSGCVLELCDNDLALLLSLWREKGLTAAAEQFERRQVVADQ